MSLQYGVSRVNLNFHLVRIRFLNKYEIDGNYRVYIYYICVYTPTRVLFRHGNVEMTEKIQVRLHVKYFIVLNGICVYGHARAKWTFGSRVDSCRYSRREVSHTRYAGRKIPRECIIHP